MDARPGRWLRTGFAVTAVAVSACGGSKTPTNPSPPPSTQPPPVTASLAAPVIASPRGGQQLTDFGPVLSATNAVATGTVTNVRYRFEWSELDSFPTDSRTGTRDGVDQGTTTTSHTITGTLKPNFRYYWRVRASNDTLTSPWSNVENFITTNKGFIVGQTIYDPLTDGMTVGNRFGGSFVGGGWRADSDTDGIDYVVPGGCTSCTLEFDVTNFGRAQGAPALKDYKWVSMGDGNTFGDFTAFRDHPWKMHLEQRSDGDGTGMKLIWRNGASIEGANPGDHMQRNDSTVDWRADVVYRFTLRWTPTEFSVSVGTVNADGSVSGSRVWFAEGFGPFPYAPPNHRISLGTRSRGETMRGAIWRNVKLTSN